MTNQHLMPHSDNDLNISENTAEYNKQGEKAMFFSKYFKLKVESEKLDFVNILTYLYILIHILFQSKLVNGM